MKRLRTLEITLERLEPVARPSTSLEQYSTPAPLAARLLYHAWLKGDIERRRVCDLGTGNGIFACGAALLGAEEVVAVDMDPASLAVAKRNAALMGVGLRFLLADVTSDETFSDMSFDTVVMNPPFGAQRRHADRAFIDRALALARVIYTIENAGSLRFLEAYTKGRAYIDEVIRGDLTIPRMFTFHREERKEIPVEIVRMVVLPEDSHPGL
ncbi:MAG: METTL5 family protein [Methanomicrobiales archaeon]|nr:METTL5 family protein [Methanomicrobiales archaeon]